MLKLWPSSHFLVIVLALFGMFYLGLTRSSKRPARILVAMLGWLFVTGLLAYSGFFKEFNTIPPRHFFVIVPVILVLIYGVRSSKLIPFITPIPQLWFILIQVFRVDMELVLWGLERQHRIPDIMTWNGHNFDILIGISAPVMAYLWVKKTWVSKWTLMLWNGLGLLSLANVFILGLLSAPGLLQLIVTDPPNTFIATLPYIWLPAFVLPSAVLFHIMSIRKLATSDGTS